MRAKETARVIRAIAQSFESYPTQLSIRVNVLDSQIVSSGPDPAGSRRADPDGEGAKAAIDDHLVAVIAALRELADAARAKRPKLCRQLYAHLDDLGFVPPVVLAVTGLCLKAAKLLPLSD